MSWSPLIQEDAEKFIKSVADENEPALFDLALCNVHSFPLSFYDGYSLYRIANKYMIPNLVLDYLSNGEDHYYLDGSDAPFQNLNARQAISLNEHNVADYLKFYISYVYERGNSFEFSLQISDDDPVQLILIDIENSLYKLEADILYQGAKHKARITVEENGSIHVQAPVIVSFLESPSPQTKAPYRHPLENTIIEGTKSLLSATKKGVKFLKILEEHKVEVRIITSPNYMGITHTSNLIYLSMPIVEKTAKYAQAIILACHIQEVFQNVSGFLRPPTDIDQTTRIELNYGKNLDMILETCIMVEEYEQQNALGALKEIDAMGLRPLYEAQKTEKKPEALMGFYLKMLKETDQI